MIMYLEKHYNQQRSIVVKTDVFNVFFFYTVLPIISNFFSFEIFHVLNNIVLIK